MTEKQRLLQEIEKELRDMSEEEKQGVLDFLMNSPSCHDGNSNNG